MPLNNLMIEPAVSILWQPEAIVLLRILIDQADQFGKLILELVPGIIGLTERKPGSRDLHEEDQNNQENATAGQQEKEKNGCIHG